MADVLFCDFNLCVSLVCVARLHKSFTLLIALRSIFAVTVMSTLAVTAPSRFPKAA